MKQHRNITLLSISLIAGMILTSCNNKQKESSELQTITTGNISVIHEVSFDSVYGDLTIEQFMNLGFEFGDSVDVYFSTGDVFEDVPFFDGYYVESGKPLVVGYPGYPHIDFGFNNKGGLWQSLGLTEEDTICISLNEKAKYIVQQETFSMRYYDDRELYSSDEVFSNFRSISLSTMKDDLIYRGASPVDNQHNRASNSDKLIKQAGISYILDLADSEEELHEYMEKEDFNSPYALSLYQNNNIALLDMGADFTSDDFRNKFITGLNGLINHEGPYYVHCTEGKDRTGFVCFFLGALTGATYEELENDYMITYYNYFGITKENNPLKYQAVVDLRFKDFVSFLSPDNTSYKDAAIKYLNDGGMSTSDISQLISTISK